MTASPDMVTGQADTVAPSHFRPIEQVSIGRGLFARHMAGDGHTLVLSFSGVQGKDGGRGAPEFVATASQGGRNHVLFIGEWQPSWYSAPGVVEEVVAVVERLASRCGIRRIVSLGNSMGGYGALLFAGHLPVAQVCAFSPQISMHPDVIDEGRWSQFRGNFGPDMPRSVVPALRRATARCFVTVGLVDRLDARQVRLLPPMRRVRLHRLVRAGHAVAARLREHGLLAAAVSAQLDGDEAGLSRIYDTYETSRMPRRKLLRARWRRKFPEDLLRLLAVSPMSPADEGNRS